MKNLKFIALGLLGFLWASSAQAQVAVLGNADQCPIEVHLYWECSPCAPLNATFHNVPAMTNLNVTAPCPGAILSHIVIFYTGQGPISHTYGSCGIYNFAPANLAAVSCIGNPTVVNLSVGTFGGQQIYYADMNF